MNQSATDYEKEIQVSTVYFQAYEMVLAFLKFLDMIHCEMERNKKFPVSALSVKPVSLHTVAEMLWAFVRSFPIFEFPVSVIFCSVIQQSLNRYHIQPLFQGAISMTQRIFQVKQTSGKGDIWNTTQVCVSGKFLYPFAYGGTNCCGKSSAVQHLGWVFRGKGTI